MKTEAELRELHGRLVKVLTFAAQSGIRASQLKDLIHVKVSLEWVLGIPTKSADAWQVVLFKGLQNLEGLKRTHDRSREAATN